MISVFGELNHLVDLFAHEMSELSVNRYWASSVEDCKVSVSCFWVFLCVLVQNIGIKHNFPFINIR